MNITRKKNKSIVLVIAVLLQISFFVFMQLHVSRVGGDGIFTYTLANNPYAYEYIGPEFKYFPNNNGWTDASVLKESYVVQDYDKFNFSAVYFHQRIDNHPLLYYSLVHFFSSLGSGEWSTLYTMIVNLIFVIASDILLIRLFEKIFGNEIYAIVPIIAFCLSVTIQQLAVLPRMYMTLAFFVLWFIYINYRFQIESTISKSLVIQMILCVLGGTQTHYYFYVYAFFVSAIVIVFFFIHKVFYKLVRYLYAGIIGISVSLILFPWVIWHILFNQMQKHTQINPWNMAKITKYICFINEKLFNGRGVIAILIFSIISVIAIIVARRGKISDHKKNALNYKKKFVLELILATLLFSLTIFTLDEDVWYYHTPIYIPAIIIVSIILIVLIKRIAFRFKSEAVTIAISSVLIVAVYSISSTVNSVKSLLSNDIQNQIILQITAMYKGADCIFVEEAEDGLFSGMYLDLGEYDEFKKISIDDYNTDGLTHQRIDGRETNDDIVIVVPRNKDNVFPGKVLLQSDSCDMYLLSKSEQEAIQ